MVCTNCGKEGHNITTCPILREGETKAQTCPLGRNADEELSKRGQRESPRTPAKEDAAKMDKLRELSTKLSPKPAVPPFSEEEHKAAPEVGSASSGVESVTLEAIQQIMAKTLDEKLKPLNKSIDQIFKDLSEFKQTVRKELNTMGLLCLQSKRKPPTPWKKYRT